MNHTVKNLLIAGGVVLGIILILSWATQPASTPPSEVPTQEQIDAGAVAVSGSATYVLEGQLVTLVNGEHAEQIPNSSTSIVTKLTEHVTTGNLDEDGLIDIGNVLVQTPGGSGTFYYVAAVINRGENTFQGTNAVLVGDRVTIESIAIQDKVLVVNYLDRGPEDAMASEPTVKSTKYFVFDGTTLKEAEVVN